ncbi:MAG: hypothetical protein AAF721_06175 [Myxococcota bacterium]
MRGWHSGLWIACLALGCGANGVFLCESDVECGRGQCEANGYCSFEDQRCEGGRRYGAHSGDLAEVCVGPLANGSSSEGSSEGEPPQAPSSSSETTGFGTTAQVGDETSGGSTAAGSSGAASDSGTGSTSTSGASSESTDTGPTWPHPYGACEADRDCPPGALCTQTGFSQTSQCFPTCMSLADCPDPPTPADQQCVMGACVLYCEDGSDCPMDLVCSQGFLSACAPP